MTIPLKPNEVDGCFRELKDAFYYGETERFVRALDDLKVIIKKIAVQTPHLVQDVYPEMMEALESPNEEQP